MVSLKLNPDRNTTRGEPTRDAQRRLAGKVGRKRVVDGGGRRRFSRKDRPLDADQESLDPGLRV